MITRKQALIDSEKHWAENVEKAERGGLSLGDIDGTRCALCEKYAYGRPAHELCDNCPLFINVMGCGRSGSPWRTVRDSTYLSEEECVLATKNMHQILKDLVTKYVKE